MILYMKKVINFLKKHYPVLLLVVLPPIFLLSLKNDVFREITLNLTIVLAVLMGIVLLIGLLLLIKYILSLYIIAIKNKDTDSLILALIWTLAVMLFVILVLYGDEINEFLF